MIRMAGLIKDCCIRLSAPRLKRVIAIHAMEGEQAGGKAGLFHIDSHVVRVVNAMVICLGEPACFMVVKKNLWNAG